jgi:glutaredoxin
MRRLQGTLAAAVTLAILTAAGCGRDTGGPPAELSAISGGNILYTWASPAGGFASSTDLGAIPAASRGWVMIEYLKAPLTAGEAEGVIVADLDGVLPGGKISGRLLDRASYEAGALAAVAAAAPPMVPSPTGAAGVAALPGARGGVVMYSASWCGVCASARKYFASKGVPMVEKDVEKDAGARDELLGKTRAAGMAYKGGVPVLDIGGRLLMGFDARVVENALKAAGLLG